MALSLNETYALGAALHRLRPTQNDDPAGLEMWKKLVQVTSSRAIAPKHLGAFLDAAGYRTAVAQTV